MIFVQNILIVLLFTLSSLLSIKMLNEYLYPWQHLFEHNPYYAFLQIIVPSLLKLVVIQGRFYYLSTIEPKL